MRGIFLVCSLLCLPVSAEAQRIATELICAWHSTTPVAKQRAVPTSVATEIADGIVLLRFQDSLDASRAIVSLAKDSRVAAVQYNYLVGFRRVPNDPQYFRQTNMQRSGFEGAWALATGGQTPEGVPIVTAILDAGFDTSHEDLVPNLWRNREEIPGDGIDNDANGYVDDVTGWNFVNDSPNHPPNNHGTAVAGLLGARGDNGVGVSGTNWDAQLMLFTISNVADIIEAYQYIIDQRT
ncbi:MAG: S8 family serine peptidase, partial [Lewinella sp.]